MGDPLSGSWSLISAMLRIVSPEQLAVEACDGLVEKEVKMVPRIKMKVLVLGSFHVERKRL